MSLKVLRFLREGNVIAYCLPAHTRGKTRPLDLTVIGAFIHHIAANMKSISLVNHHDLFDCCDSCNILRDVYEKSFTPSNICAGFERAGLWPINADRLLDSPKPDGLNGGVMVPVDDMLRLLQQKKLACGSEMNIQPIVLKKGFLDTSKGLNLMISEEMKTIKHEEAIKQAKCDEMNAKRAATEAKKAFQAEKKRREREEMFIACSKRRASLYGEPIVLPRPFSVRRAVAAKRAAERREAASALGHLGGRF